MSADSEHPAGMVRPAPEGFLGDRAIGEISREGIDDRRRALLKASFMGALAGSMALPGGSYGTSSVVDMIIPGCAEKCLAHIV